MMPRALTLPLLLALVGCSRSTPPPRALPPPPPPVDASTASDAPADATAAPTASAAPLRDLVALDLTPYSGTCAVHRDGSVWCWGDHAHLWAPVGPVPDVPNGPDGAAPLPGVSGATAVCLLSEAVCVLRSDRSVLCRVLVSDHNEETGDTAQRVTEVAPAALRDITALVRTDAMCVATNSAGQSLQLQEGAELIVNRLQVPPRRCTLGAEETRCVGSNGAGILANETTAAFTAQTPARLFGLRGLRDVAWSGNHACAALGDGTIHCWGRNLDAQLGLADLRSRALPTAVPGLDGVVSLAAIDRATCAVRTDGTVWCWGYNEHGVFGTEGRVTQTAPRPVAGVGDVASLSLRDSVACALRRDGSVWCWGNYAPRTPGTPIWQPRPIVRAPETARPTPASPG